MTLFTSFAPALFAILSLSISTQIYANDEPELPLKGQTTKLNLSLDEATWLSLDVSADGDSLVFDLLGDIYSLPMAGGKATQLTSGLGFDSQPVLSPDGSKLAFISDRDGGINLWIMNADGSQAKPLSKGGLNSFVSPTWSPDGQSIVVSKMGANPSFHLFYLDGDGSIELTDESAEVFGGVGARFSPDGRFIYYTIISRPARGSFPTSQIHRFDIKTGDLERITQGHGGGVRPEVSPDGQYLTYVTRLENKAQMRIRNLKTGADRQLVANVQHDLQELGRTPSRDVFPGYSFTPDSKAVVYTYGGKINKVDIAQGTISEIPFRVDVSLDVGPELSSPYKLDTGPVEARIVHNPSSSPDGKKIVMSILSQLYLADADGDNIERLTKSDAWEFQPVYSPDGKWISYVTWSMDKGGQIWRVKASGRGRPQQLTRIPAFYTDIAWSKDGERIVAMRGNEWQRHQTFSEFGGLDIDLEMIWLPSSGGDSTIVAPANDARHPHFGLEDDRIYAYNAEALFSYRYDGSDMKTHIKVSVPQGLRQQTEPSYAEAIKVSPNSEHVLALVGKQLWVMPLRTYGGKETLVDIRSPALPIQRLTDIGADFFDWSKDGSTITWAIGSSYFKRQLSSVDFGKEEDDIDDTKDKDGEAAVDVTVSSSPDANAEQAATDNQPKKPPLEEDDNVTMTKITLKVERYRPSGSILLSGANVIQMAGATNEDYSQVLRNADILVTNDRIVAVGAKGSIALPEDVKTIDMTGKYIMPGMIDTHAHWEFRTGDVLEPQNWSLLANLAYGVTTGLDVQTTHKDYFTYRDMVETGQSIGQRALMTGPGVFSPNDFQSYDSAYYYLKRYSDHYKTKNIKSYVAGNREQRQWIVQASQLLGLMPTTEGAQDLALDITHAIDGMHGNEHNMPVFPLYKDVTQLYANTQTAYTATLLVQYNGIGMTNYFFTRENVHDNEKLQRFYPHNRLDELSKRQSLWAMQEEFNFKHVAMGVADIQRAGGLVGMGGHGELQGLGYHWELWAHSLGGMKNVEILRAATIDGAKIIGVNQDLGSIEVGKVADMVILDSNPLADIRNTEAIHLVMKDGFLYQGDTLKQIWPIEKPLGGYWWWHEN
jgi:Tol biopolymer transport system component